MTRSSPSVSIVGIGASAGGLAAFTELLEQLDPATGLALVLVPHLDANHPSRLAEALQAVTSMPVSTAHDGMLIEPDHVYVIAADSWLTVANGRLVTLPRADDSLHLSIDGFFSSLAEDNGKRSIGVVLSGNGSDGTAGLRAIKDVGGIAIAQDPSTASSDSMPRSAIESGVVDSVLTIPAIAAELGRLSRHPYLLSSDSLERSESSSWDAIFALVREESGIDFRDYKSATLSRRLARRLALQKTDSLEAYLAILRSTPAELTALSRDALIHVTSFFRDEDAFASLQQHVLPTILARKSAHTAVRVWVPGCSTGEEVYSLAIALHEVLRGSARTVQFFGSDVSLTALQTARTAVYSEAAMQPLSQERRETYFIQVDQGYRVIKALREQCVFVPHDVTRDPPFSQLDLISCRNLLIYFNTSLQQRVAARFHFGLREPGFLMLGRNEAMDGFRQLFRPVDRENKLFERNPGTKTVRLTSDVARFELSTFGPARERAPEDERRQETLGKMVDRMLAARYAPPGVVVDERFEVLQFRGHTGAFLQPAPGAPQANLLQMARNGLSLPLRVGLARAQKEAALVRSMGVQVTEPGNEATCDLVFLPLPGATNERALFLILFEAQAPSPSVQSAAEPVPATQHAQALLDELREELSSTKEYLHSVIGEHGRSREHLENVNEELLSSNEEFQSINEELGTAKEELQSINEELSTVNDELNERNREVTQANTDLTNLLTAVDVPMVILDSERKIRHFTPKARRLLNVLPMDVGRHVGDLKLNIDVPQLDAMIGEAIASTTVSETEIKDLDGSWYRLQIRPYRTAEGRVDGAIVSLFDIDGFKRSVEEAQQANALAERANRAKDEFLANLSHELRTPLTSMLIRAQLLRGGKLKDATQVVESAAVLEAAVVSQIRLVDDLLDVSRIASGSFHMTMQTVDLEQVIRVALAALPPERESTAPTLKLELQPIGSVTGDPSRLQQVVENLVQNALKFTPDGGTIQVSLFGSSGRAVLRVKDDGIGIAAEFLPRVFERFAQENGSSAREHAGLGLGLSIVRDLVELHGGSVSAESAGHGRGTTMTVYLPLAPADAAKP